MKIFPENKYLKPQLGGAGKKCQNNKCKFKREL